MPYDLVIKNGLLITASESFIADVAISGERIAAIGTDLSGGREIDARGLYVLPGAIDGHVHLTDPTYPPYSIPTADSFGSGTVAAAFGGVTTVIDFAQPAPGQSLIEGLDRRQEDADGHAVVDYALHLTLRDRDPARLAEVPAVFQRGVPSFKFFMAYEGYRLDDVAMFRAMEAVAAHDGLAIVHAENFDIITELRRRLRAERKFGPRWHVAACPSVAEGEAVHRALALAHLAGARVLIYHQSCIEGLREIRLAKARGQAAFGEVCVQYLVLTDEVCVRDDLAAQALAISPPLRDKAHQAALWQGLADGTLDIVSTDHNPRHRQDQPLHHPPGTSSIETRLALMHTFGVKAGRLSLNRWVEVCCSRPARVFGLTGKGRLAPNYDADIVLFDPTVEVALTTGTLHSSIGFCTYEGMRTIGFPVMTISRGEAIVENGNFVGKPGRGRFVERGF
ncbi:MAG: dihydropyrimidinase [Chloroflexi bacterium]|nr:dihydropyrimidinase [Chloroflexota bacterium]